MVSLVVKNPPANAGDTRDVGLISGLGRSTGGGNGNPLPYSCLENSMDRGASWAIVHGVAESWTQLSDQVHKVIKEYMCVCVCIYFTISIYFNTMRPEAEESSYFMRPTETARL